MSEFAGFPVRMIEKRVWVAGQANSIVGQKAAWVRDPSRCLSRDAVYEVEGAVAISDEASITASAVQDTLRAASQLSGDPNIELLSERRPLIRCIEPVRVPVLEAVGTQAERELGVRSDEAAVPAHEDCRPLRRAVSALRTEGWDGAILLPGPARGVSSIVIPRSFAYEGQLMISFAERIPVPRAVVEYAFGLNWAFPESCWRWPASLRTMRDAS